MLVLGVVGRDDHLDDGVAEARIPPAGRVLLRRRREGVRAVAARHAGLERPVAPMGHEVHLRVGEELEGPGRVHVLQRAAVVVEHGEVVARLDQEPAGHAGVPDVVRQRRDDRRKALHGRQLVADTALEHHIEHGLRGVRSVQRAVVRVLSLIVHIHLQEVVGQLPPVQAQRADEAQLHAQNAGAEVQDGELDAELAELEDVELPRPHRGHELVEEGDHAGREVGDLLQRRDGRAAALAPLVLARGSQRLEGDAVLVQGVQRRPIQGQVELPGTGHEGSRLAPAHARPQANSALPD
mmetsp:Transcript_2500/g.10508  ORF Transcript_2500/g.10508 Transcript_2500/m.10508 type:complete len:296 (-) Transcript_2500:916-1803(-)